MGNSRIGDQCSYRHTRDVKTNNIKSLHLPPFPCLVGAGKPLSEMIIIEGISALKEEEANRTQTTLLDGSRFDLRHEVKQQRPSFPISQKCSFQYPTQSASNKRRTAIKQLTKLLLNGFGQDTEKKLELYSRNPIFPSGQTTSGLFTLFSVQKQTSCCHSS
ncbi:hypothetical protein AVEN_255718-1 [Araneus ventricosus]|uniref:Uncharacterized protein n=1 Tax=Araneus ventricosus TaxID=182803 RepID=A0A4Y2PRN2_ARAVE|nr:hypothetical protein AVEN_255718-1 [Araneus ventricosus]